MLRVFDHSSHQTRFDTTLAWDAIARPHIQKREYQDTLAAVLISGTAMRKSSLVTLDPKAVKLIDAMADAVGVPRMRGQRTFDLLTPDQKDSFRQIHPQIAREGGI
jgi:hypothetical protein